MKQYIQLINTGNENEALFSSYLFPEVMEHLVKEFYDTELDGDLIEYLEERGFERIFVENVYM